MTDKVIQICLDRLRENPGDWNARLSLGRLYFEKGMLEEAQKELEKVANVISNNVIIYKILGEIYEKEGNIEEAERFYRIFSAYGANHSEINGILNSSETLDQIREEKVPEKTISKELGGQPENNIRISTNTIAEIYIKQGHFKKALETYRDILTKDPENTVIQNKIKALMEKVGESSLNEADISLISSKTERIITTLNKWLGNLEVLKGETGR
ncbi:MAG: tetratricopeptide repeat protein [Pseudomonadota bacterium]